MAAEIWHDGERVRVTRSPGGGRKAFAPVSFEIDVDEALRLEILPVSTATTIGRVLGGQDLILGDERFDAAFMVKADDEALARTVLTRRVREALLFGSHGFRYEMHQGVAIAASMWSQDHAAQETNALAALIALGRGRRTLMADWRSAATTLGVELPPGETFPAAGLTFALRRDGVVVELRVAQDGPPPRVWRTSLRTRFVRAGDAPLAFHVHADPRRREILLDSAPEHDAAARAHISVELKRLLFATEGVAALDDGGAVIVWHGHDPDPGHLAQAATLVAAWAAAPAGRAYR